MRETTVGVRELKTQLSKYLRQVKAGRTIVITERGRTVGRIVPDEESLDDRLQAMVKAGLAQWNGKKLKPPKPVTTLPEGRSISDLIIEDRR
jgi:prevent-host-death family protein